MPLTLAAQRVRAEKLRESNVRAARRAAFHIRRIQYKESSLIPMHMYASMTNAFDKI